MEPPVIVWPPGIMCDSELAPSEPAITAAMNATAIAVAISMVMACLVVVRPRGNRDVTATSSSEPDCSDMLSETIQVWLQC